MVSGRSTSETAPTATRLGHPALGLAPGPLLSMARTLDQAAATGVNTTRAALSLLTLRNLAGVLAESFWVGSRVALYPLGAFGTRSSHGRTGHQIQDLSPTQRSLVVSNVEAAGTPILLLHGFFDNRSIFTLLRRGLARRGFGRIETMNYSILTGDVRVAAAQLANEVERIVRETGYERIHIVGHSLGGLIARYYVTRLGGDENVHTLVTLGTPHQGTYTAYLWPSSLTRQLRPGSALLSELEQPIPSCKTRFVAYWSDLDEIVLPPRHAAMDHSDLNVHNIELSGVGHLSLPNVGLVVRGIAMALAHLDESGATVASGVTPIKTAAATRKPGTARTPKGRAGAARPHSRTPRH